MTELTALPNTGTPEGLKVRFGYTLGPEVAPEDLPALVDGLEEFGFDSLWVPEVFLQPTLDPIVALTFAAARTTKLKLGTHLIVPGKNPVQLARQLAQLDRVSGGRLLLLAVLGLPDEADTGAQIMERSQRGAAMEEVIPLLRELWTGQPVTHHGDRYRLDNVTVTPTPAQDPLEIWLAGQAPSALRRCGRLGEGWMPGMLSPAEAVEKRQIVEEAAAAVGREMDAEHYGINLFYATQDLPSEVRERLEARRPNGDLEEILPTSMESLRTIAGQWLDAGFSKFLLRPLVPPTNQHGELEMLANEILPLTR